MEDLSDLACASGIFFAILNHVYKINMICYYSSIVKILWIL